MLFCNAIVSNTRGGTAVSSLHRAAPRGLRGRATARTTCSGEISREHGAPCSRAQFEVEALRAQFERAEGTPGEQFCAGRQGRFRRTVTAQEFLDKKNKIHQIEDPEFLDGLS